MNVIPRNPDEVVVLAEDAADGAATYGVAVGVAQNTEAKIRADLEAVVGRPAGQNGVPPAVKGTQQLWAEAKSNKTAKTAAARSARSNGMTLARTCISILKPRLGNQWNSAWNEAGFTNGSLIIPSNPMTTLQQLRAYFNSHPSHQIDDVGGVECTADGCESAVQTISYTQSASNQSNTDAGVARRNFYASVDALRSRLSGLREELSHLLSDTDERWYAFGFRRPADGASPDAPENLTVVPGAAGSRSLFVDWDDVSLATSYRVKISRQDGTVIVNTTVSESDFMAQDLPAGQTVLVEISARNDTGESGAVSTSAVVP